MSVFAEMNIATIDPGNKSVGMACFHKGCDERHFHVRRGIKDGSHVSLATLTLACENHVTLHHEDPELVSGAPEADEPMQGLIPGTMVMTIMLKTPGSQSTAYVKLPLDLSMLNDPNALRWAAGRALIKLAELQQGKYHGAACWPPVQDKP